MFADQVFGWFVHLWRELLVPCCLLSELRAVSWLRACMCDTAYTEEVSECGMPSSGRATEIGRHAV